MLIVSVMTFNKFPEIKGILLTKCEITAYKNTQ